MRRFLPVAVVVASIVLGATAFRGEVASAAMQALQVFVTNSAADPVPVAQQGTANVNVLGSVLTRPNIPATQFSRSFLGAHVVSGPDPAGTNYAITSMSVANLGSTSAFANVAALYGTTTDCSAFTGGVPDFTIGPDASVPGGGTISLVFPQPFILNAKAGAQSCLNISSAAPLHVTIVGYRF